jgi:VanZ family protein
MTYLRWILWALTLAYWATLFVFTHLPPSRLPHPDVNDKLEHFLAYGLLSGMMGLTLWVAFPTRRWVARLPLLIVVGAAAYGAFDELTQPLTRRTADIHDWFADCAGAVAAAVVLFLLQRAFSARISARPTASPAPLA